ncbi:1,4-alpha-glucan branching protein GlgB [Herbaspirillum sp. RTI4]|uniref:1,4-alpha-glucan branching protein GlgB n=1 Tax=Herbaspirillum sp. RTI4 TaxID=3048640 RepID=UPI002AB5A1DA|nr:1,4-alpha-glucan branching protein GlgB [Herbaspirillum sp. RTI4]MDY7579065.1 1,4-alpha-glucan branching protein GlgB [Herbaspirillum sp. RTI4]MEA9982351.1 1,4-alpha-glucan branching protein GlgB [Herbaspirillum sp. RTI4]
MPIKTPGTVSLASVEAALTDALLQGHLGDPFALLGAHPIRQKDGEHDVRICSFQPGAAAVHVHSAKKPAHRLATLKSQEDSSGASDGLFTGTLSLPDKASGGARYLLHVEWLDAQGKLTTQVTEDAYAFGLLLSDFDLHLLAQGKHREMGRCLGAQSLVIDGVAGTRFAVWAPNARRVSVVGDFNSWDGRRHGMRLRPNAGVWEIFLPRIGPGAAYKYEMLGPDGSLLPRKADPVARATEIPPATASIVADNLAFDWTDHDWLAARPQRQARNAPLSIYEVHPASWMRMAEQGHRSLDWNELGERLIPYARELGFTHLELMPVMEHPFGGSWGYQPLSQFAPSARFGSPEDFARFVDACHAAGLGLILDWVPAHFPADQHGLALFDGTALYEHADPREGFHPDWNTLIYNLGRNEVRGFLIASALEWLEHFHIDGLRVDAVASMLYRDYSRKSGEWVSNKYGGRENLEAVSFLRELNQTVAERCPGVLMIAEESTAWPGVSAAVEQGGLGFSYKWNMGWMHDSLRYMGYDPLFRQYHHQDFTFGLAYAFSERFVLPISHDEVVHGKGSLLSKMPGDESEKLANLRAYLGFMWTHPGKKLLFMGCELAQHKEFDHDASPQWELLDDPRHRGVQSLVRDLNHLYAAVPALHQSDDLAEGFCWVVGDDQHNSVFAWLRYGEGGIDAAPPVLVVVNMTPVLRAGYRIGVPEINGKSGFWRELLNTDAAIYGGSNQGNQGAVALERTASHGYPTSLQLLLPPLSTIVLQWQAHAVFRKGNAV